MIQNVLASQCHLCARIAARTASRHASLDTVIPTSASLLQHRNLATSSRWSRLPPKASSSKRKEIDVHALAQQKSGRAGVRRANAGGGGARPAYSAFKLSSENPETPTSGEGPVKLNQQAILDALRQKQQELLGVGARNHEQDSASSRAKPTMVPILRAMAKRLALDKEELLALAKIWAKKMPFPIKVDIKGKKRSSDDDAFNIEDVERDMEIYGERAIERAVLSQYLRWIRSQDGRQEYPTPASPANKRISLQLAAIAESLDLRYPGEWYPSARAMKRKIILHVGPTNSGKTYNALCALAKARVGAFGGPLRLLAAEVHNRFNAGTIGGLTPEKPRLCNLLTGEERKIHDELGGLESCTVEMMPLNRVFDVVVIDEIQMIADPGRGSAWTQALLGLRAKEIHLCGEPSVVDLIKRIGHSLGDEVEVKTYQRLSPLTVAKHSIGGDWTKIRRGDCVVAFSRNTIFELKNQIQEATGLRVAVAYGGLPPEVREEQAKGFNNPDEEGGYDVLVASDAIGMGLNLQIRRVIFTTLVKWDGRQEVPLSFSQVKQIGGRAGRFGMKSKVSSPSAPDELEPVEVTGDGVAQSTVDDNLSPETEEEMNGIVTCVEEHDMPQLRKAMAAPATPIQRAALAPSSDQLEHFATLLPRETTQAHVFEIFPVIATSGSDYYIPSFGSPLRLAEKLSSIERLTIGERWLLGNAPVNVRDAEVLQAFTTFVERFSIDEGLKVTQWIQAQGMSATLQAFREAEDVMSKLQAEHEVQEVGKEETVDAEDAPEQKIVPEFPLPGLVVNFATNANLIELESLHRCLGLYLWLHHRFSLRFPQAAEARLFKTEVQNGIDFILQHMSPAAKAAKLAQEEQSRKRVKGRR